MTSKLRRGDIWMVNLDPTVGAEIKKKRPAVIISSDAVGRLPIKLAAPITEWKEYFSNNLWHVRIEPDDMNGLSKVSAVDALQIRGLDDQRFVQKLGRLDELILNEIALAIAAVIEL